VTAAKEPLAGRDHGGGITRAGPARPAGGEVDISLTGDVEAMTAAACQLAAAQLQRPGADRAAQVRGDRRERLAPLSGRRYAVTLPAGRTAWVHRNAPSNRKDDQPTAARTAESL
jgi:hypothetical protein